MKTLTKTLLLVSIFLLSGCVKDVDFDQVDDANIYASYIVTLIHFDLAPIKFLDEYNQEITYTSDFVAAKISNDSQKYLERIEFTTITENTYNRDFTIDVIFYNEALTPIYKLSPSISVNSNTNSTIIIEIPENEVQYIYEARYFGFSVAMSPSTDGSTLSADETYNLNFKSSAELFFNYRNI